MSPAPLRGEARIGTVVLFAALATLSAFSIDTYVPALAAVRQDLRGSAVEVQQTLSAYMFGLSVMALWHGAISDAVGRRPVMIVGLSIYTVASLGCAIATDVTTLIGLRFVQGLAGGVGMIIVRAMVRDTLEGAGAQRLMSHVMMMFSIAPGIAPIIGGFLYVAFGWRSIFWFLCAGGAVLVAWSYLALPETLPASKRQSLHPLKLAKGYALVFRSPAFWALTAAASMSFQAFFQYVGAAHPFLVEQLRLRETQFAVLFIPVVIGFMIGSGVSGRVAGKWSVRRTASVAFALMLIAALFNVGYHALWRPGVIPSIAPIFVGAVGLAMLSPITQIMVLDLFPTMRGLASSCQAFVQLMVSAISLGVVSIALSVSTLTLALGQLGWIMLGLLAWLGFLAADRSTRRRRTLLARID